MANVMIKSFPNGISVVLDPNIPFEQLYIEYAEKFRDSSKFFGKAKRVISFEGRELSSLEERALLEAISEYTDLTVTCVVSKDDESNQLYLKAASSFLVSDSTSSGQIYKGCVKAEHNIESASSIIILGDVNPGAVVKSNGSVVVLGTIYGNVEAGAEGDTTSFVAAIDFKSSAVKIADKVCKILPKSAGFLRTKPGPRIVFVGKDGIDIEEITKDFLMNLPF